MAAGGTAARDEKMRLAREIVSQFHGAQAAEEAQTEFARVFSRGEQPEALPEDVPWDVLPFVDSVIAVGISPEEIARQGSRSIKLATLLVQLGVTTSLSEARRLIDQGAVEIDGKIVTQKIVRVKPGAAIRVGKHRFLRIVETG